ncbi:MAG: SIS domain-containing protein, partial [Solirubrobacteraceae bacterium]
MSVESWHTDEHPELRDAPPWVTEEMTAAQPELPRAILGAPSAAVDELAGAVRGAAAGQPVTVVGCGTSEHGAMAVAALLADALGGGWPPAAAWRQSLDAAEHPQRGGVCIGVSHDGGTRATALALEAARDAGATTALVTNRPGGSASKPSAIVLETPMHDDSWCHTVAYTSVILAGAAVARELGLEGVDAGAAEALLRAAPE